MKDLEGLNDLLDLLGGGKMGMIENMIPFVAKMEMADGKSLEETMKKIIKQDDKQTMREIKRQTGEKISYEEYQYHKALAELTAINSIAKDNMFIKYERKRNELADYLEKIADDIRNIDGDIDE